MGHINGEFGEVGHPVVHYLHRPVPREDLIAFFVAADVMLVTPLRDGMNLVAKEYVACRSDLGGSLVLSEFTGAAAELRQAYLVNPHDIDGVKDGIESALNQTPKRDGAGCGRYAVRCSHMTWIGGHARSWKHCPPRRPATRSHRSSPRYWVANLSKAA